MSEQAKTDLDENQKLQEFSYAVSHDLGAAIRGISQLTGLLEHDISEKINDKERYWMQLIKASADKAQSMIEAMTLYTRLATTSESDSVLALDNLIDNALTHCFHEAHKKSLADNLEQPLFIEPEVDFELASIEIMAKKSHWTLLLCSLINNALEFQKVDLSPKISIRLSLLDDNKRANLTIEDNGLGVKDEKISDICKPFSSSRDRDELHHLGMGLSYCARIADLNQASLRFGKSRLGGFKVEYEFLV